MPELIGLDFETYGAEDLPTHGLARYTSHKTFMPLIGSTASRGTSGTSQSGHLVRARYNFVTDRRFSTNELRDTIGGRLIVAHNAPFEQEVLDNLGLSYPSSRFIDSAVVARAAGAASKLEAAAPQLLNINKMEEGRNLIKLFSIPGKYQEDSGSLLFDPRVIDDHPQEWDTFMKYCDLDAELGLRIAEDYLGYLTKSELEFQAVTMDMNRTGWCVDVPLVEEMLRRSKENQDVALEEFRVTCNAPDLNLNSLKQLKEWCSDRGIKATSFDEKHVERLLARIEKKIDSMSPADSKFVGYVEVRDLLKTKQILGGSSLKKLPVILNTAQDQGDGTHRLKDQYLHCGAGQTLRTTGIKVQMQNLKTFEGVEPDDMDELDDLAVEWDNTKLARNIRQCFTATDPAGALIVGDFGSVESRGLAWYAGAEWKLDAYRKGKDMYKVLASQFYGLAYDAIDKKSQERTFGKVGELSCGYGAGSDAVMGFAEGMGVLLTEGEAAKLVTDWRGANPEVLAFWARLDEMLHCVVEGQRTAEIHYLPDNLMLRIQVSPTPTSLQTQHPGAMSIQLTVENQHTGHTLLKRYFHGCYIRGRDVCYYKPSDRKTGYLWKNNFIHPKTKQLTFYKLYGGKLAGILTQSLCREIFFRTLVQVDTWTKAHGNLLLVGQFHDEVVVDWKPAVAAIGLDEAKAQLDTIMSDAGSLTSFPLAADIKHDYRYTK